MPSFGGFATLAALSVIVCPGGVGTLCARMNHGGTYSFSLLFPTLGADMASHHAPPFLLAGAEKI
jgi:hypothetical protein